MELNVPDIDKDDFVDWVEISYPELDIDLSSSDKVKKLWAKLGKTYKSEKVDTGSSRDIIS
tara:strand:- start:286 stop:468 length:183 start_codon:yes stop_codon:yes gene_type:complete